mmetsp:Transcript_6073/g.15032  ORF Transcript_6073/g.15032 Transcript_6073/m.15032 type:complete len:368 (+) Transcript_6073:483-1586(+)
MAAIIPPAIFASGNFPSSLSVSKAFGTAVVVVFIAFDSVAFCLEISSFFFADTAFASSFSFAAWSFLGLAAASSFAFCWASTSFFFSAAVLASCSFSASFFSDSLSTVFFSIVEPSTFGFAITTAGTFPFPPTASGGDADGDCRATTAARASARPPLTTTGLGESPEDAVATVDPFARAVAPRPLAFCPPPVARVSFFPPRAKAFFLGLALGLALVFALPTAVCFASRTSLPLSSCDRIAANPPNPAAVRATVEKVPPPDAVSIGGVVTTSVCFALLRDGFSETGSESFGLIVRLFFCATDFGTGSFGLSFFFPFGASATGCGAGSFGLSFFFSLGGLEADSDGFGSLGLPFFFLSSLGISNSEAAS